MLSSMVQDKPLPWRQACRYVKTLAEAVQFAHQKGILHRDLKPQNVLIDRFDAPKIADFGLSRQIGYEGGLTVTGQMIGTPNYMPLEQALGEHSKVGPWSDVYSLGAILYELVTTIPPFLGTTIADIVDRLQRQQPIAPIGVNPTIPSDLNTVILKCLEKDSDQRYASAAELAVELSRVLRDIPIEARPISPPHRLWRWGKRNPALAALSAFAAIMVAVIAVVSTFYYWQTSQALSASIAFSAREAHLRQEAEAARSDLSTALSRSDFLRGLEFINQDIPKPAEGLAYLASSLRHDPKNQAAQTRLVSMLASRAWMVPVGSPLKHSGNVVKVVFSPDGKFVLTASYDGTATLWNAKTGEKIRGMGKHDKPLRDACFSADGKYVATASEDGTARIMLTSSGRPITQLALKSNTGPMNTVAFDPEGKWLLTAADGGSVALWNAVTGEPVPRLGSRTRPLSTGVLFARFSPDGKLIVAGCGSTALLWDVESGSQIQTISCNGDVSSANFSPDSQQLVVAVTGTPTDNTSFYAQIYDTKTGVTVGNRMGHGAGIVDAVFSPNGKYVATASLDRTARVWNAQTGNPVTGALRHPLGLTSLAFSPDSRQLLTGGVSGAAMLWNTETGAPEVSPLQQSEQIFSVAFSPDGKSIATAMADNTARLYLIGRPPSPPLEMKQPGVLKARFNPAGDRVLSWGTGTEIMLWDGLTGKLISKLEHPDQGRVGAEWSADGKTILTYQAFRAARLWDGTTGKPVSPWLAEDSHLRMATLSPDSRFVLTTLDTLDRNQIGLFDAATGKQHGSYIDVQGSVSYVAFNRDAKRFGIITAAQGTTNQPESMRVWDVDLLAAVDAPLGQVYDVPQHDDRINPNGLLQLVWRSDKVAAFLWDYKKGREMSKEMRHGDPIMAARFSPDGRFVVTGSSDSTARVWDTATARPVTPPLQHAGVVQAVAMSPDSTSIATIASPQPSPFPLIRRQTKIESTIVVWDKETDMPVTDALPHAGQPRDVSFSPNGRRLLACWTDGSIGIWTIKLGPEITPQWLPEIAESLAGMKLNSLGVLETIPDPAALLRTATNQLPATSAAAETVAKGKGKESGPRHGQHGTAGGPPSPAPSNAPPGPLNALATAITQPETEKPQP